MVLMQSVDRKLDTVAKEMANMKNKELDKLELVKMGMEEDSWEKYSGELFEGHMEVMEDDGQRLVRDEGIRSNRCGFWAVRKMVERYNRRSYMRLLRLSSKPPKRKTSRRSRTPWRTGRARWQHMKMNTEKK